MPDVPRRPTLRLVVLALLGSAPALAASPPSRPIVAGYERFHADADRDGDRAEGGRLLIGELNCASCHRSGLASFDPVPRKQAPVLDRVGSRVRLEHLRAFLGDPKGTKPGTTMPDLLAGHDGPEKQAQVEELVHFLATTGEVAESSPARGAIRTGRSDYAQVGCVACHGPREGDASPASGIVPIGDPAGKYSVASLAAFLRDPLATRPSGRMPALGLTPDEAKGIAAYLMKDVQVTTPPNVAYQYYEGRWTRLPDFDQLTPQATGMARGFDLDVARRKNHFAIRFEGMLVIPREGTFTFRIRSDDGASLLIGNRLIDNDGIHPASEVSGTVRMTPGVRKIIATYFDGGGEVEFDVDVEGPGMPRQSLGATLLPPDDAKGDGPAPARPAPRFAVDPKKAARGRSAFASLGCASCHTLREGGKAIAARLPDFASDRLRPDAGCLAKEPPKGAPDFHLDDGQRAAIAAAIGPDRRSTAPDRPRQIARTMLAANCYACHRRDGVGGIEEPLNPSFATTQKEMGDEGRIPPSLDGVGGKLSSRWLRQILAEGSKDRPYMLARMPRFGAGNVGHLADLFEAGDLVAPVPVVDLGVTERKAKAIGRSLVGNTGFSCGSCHTFGKIEANGIQAIDMTRMTQRLRRDWFHRYVVDPQAFRPGTRMPSAWPEGQSQLDSVLGGDTAKQVESIWRYLSDGPKAAVPAGIGRDPIPLVADKEAIIFRNFIEGAGPRAIGVGYPEKANLAFDAEGLRLALIWHGGFIDAARHWNGRGEGYQPPLGDDVLALPTGPGLARLAAPSSAWPGAKASEDRFRGYRLAPGGRPVFLYEIGGAKVEDFYEAISGGSSPLLRRTIEIDGAGKGLALRAAVGGKVEPAGDGWFAIDGEWKVRIAAENTPIIRESDGKVELIVPVKSGPGRTRIVEEFAW